MAGQELKDLPAGNGETKNEENLSSGEAEEKEAKSDYYHINHINHIIRHDKNVLSVVPVFLPKQSRGIFLSTIL